MRVAAAAGRCVRPRGAITKLPMRAGASAWQAHRGDGERRCWRARGGQAAPLASVLAFGCGVHAKKPA